MDKKRTEMNECWTCQSRCEVPGNAHIRCDTPDAEMTGAELGIRKGWFSYPSCFDPTWKTKLCTNYKAKT